MILGDDLQNTRVLLQWTKARKGMLRSINYKVHYGNQLATKFCRDYIGIMENNKQKF